MCQGFGHFSGFLHNFVLAKLATDSIRLINPFMLGDQLFTSQTSIGAITGSFMPLKAISETSPVGGPAAIQALITLFLGSQVIVNMSLT